MMHWLIFVGVVLVFLVQLMVLAVASKLYQIFAMSAEILKREANIGCEECLAKWQAGVHGKFVEHADWCKNNPRRKEGATA